MGMPSNMPPGMPPEMSSMPQNSVEQQVYSQESNDSREQPEMTQMASIIADLDRRLRTLEERYANLRKKLQLTDQNLIESERAFGKDLKILNDDSMQIKKQVNDFSDKVLMFGEELGNTAKKNDVKVIEKYLTMWNPQQFITRKELKQYLEYNKPNFQQKESEEN